MTDTIIPFPRARRCDVPSAAEELAAAKRSLDVLRSTQQLTEMTADAILAMDLDRMIALRDAIAARLSARRDAPAAPLPRLP